MDKGQLKEFMKHAREDERAKKMVEEAKGLGSLEERAKALSEVASLLDEPYSADDFATLLAEVEDGLRARSDAAAQEVEGLNIDDLDEVAGGYGVASVSSTDNPIMWKDKARDCRHQGKEIQRYGCRYDVTDFDCWSQDACTWQLIIYYNCSVDYRDNCKDLLD